MLFSNRLLGTARTYSSSQSELERAVLRCLTESNPNPRQCLVVIVCLSQRGLIQVRKANLSGFDSSSFAMNKKRALDVLFFYSWWRRCFVIGIQVKGKMTIEAKVIEATVMARKIIGVFLAILRDITSNILFCTVGLFFESIETD